MQDLLSLSKISRLFYPILSSVHIRSMNFQVVVENWMLDIFSTMLSAYLMYSEVWKILKTVSINNIKSFLKKINFKSGPWKCFKLAELRKPRLLPIKSPNCSWATTICCYTQGPRIRSSWKHILARTLKYNNNESSVEEMDRKRNDRFGKALQSSTRHSIVQICNRSKYHTPKRW